MNWDSAVEELEHLRQEVVRLKETAEYAWKNTHTIDRIRQEQDKLIEALQRERDDLRNKLEIEEKENAALLNIFGL